MVAKASPNREVAKNEKRLFTTWNAIATSIPPNITVSNPSMNPVQAIMKTPDA